MQIVATSSCHWCSGSPARRPRLAGAHPRQLVARPKRRRSSRHASRPPPQALPHSTDFFSSRGRVDRASHCCCKCNPHLSFRFQCPFLLLPFPSPASCETMEQGPLIPRVKLGTQGLEVSKLGFGCMGLTGAYNSPLDDEAGVAVIAHAFRRGVTFFDTSDVYGPHTNETLLGKALKQLPREQVQVATKFGIRRDADGASVVCGRPEYVRACCEASLRRLGVDHIDLYYQHRVDTTIPIEDTIGELKKLVEEGKVKYIGLSEASPDTIRRAHTVHPISAVQMEWSLWARDIEPEIVPLCRELGIGIVPYSPIARGFFGGRGVIQEVSAESSLQGHPRFSAENLETNKHLYLKMEELAKKHQCSPAQLALAWVLHQGDDVVPIPGTTKIKNLDANIDSLKVKLTDDDLKEITSQIREEDVAGGRQYTSLAHMTWTYADTPRK